MTENTDDCCPVEVDGAGQQVLRYKRAQRVWGGDTEVQSTLLRGHLPLDRQEPKEGERDLLAIEVHLRHHKGVDNKPKRSVAPKSCFQTQANLNISTTFLFRENPLPILCPISHILTRVIRGKAIFFDGYTSAEFFFATNLGV
jgi:hypothetical protein